MRNPDLRFGPAFASDPGLPPVPGWSIVRIPSEPELLDEAFFFHDYASDRVSKKGWIDLSARAVRQAIAEARQSLHLQFQKTVASLANQSALMAVVPQHRVAGCVAQVFGRNTRQSLLPAVLAGKVAVLTFLDESWRSEEARKQIAAGTRRVLRLEQIHERSLALRRAANARSAASAIAESFGDASLGGSLSVARPDRPAIPGPISGYGRNIGLTEKLYDQLLSDCFPSNSSERACEIPPIAPGRPPFRWHVEVSQAAALLMTECLPHLPPNETLARWLAQLTLLEGRFTKALTDRNVAAVGGRAGLPWALVLIAIMRAWVVDLAMAIFRLAMPVHGVYNEVNGNAAVGLAEALEGIPVPTVQFAGLLDVYPTLEPQEVNEPKLTGVLKSWRADSFIKAWPHNLTHEYVAQSFASIAKRPVLNGGATPVESKSGRLHGSPRDGRSVKDEVALWPRHSRVIFPMRRWNARADYVEGASVAGHVHLYVASSLLSTAINVMGLEVPSGDELDDDDDIVLPSDGSPPSAPNPHVAERGLPTRADMSRLGEFSPSTYRLISGSLLWGGNSPPHKTHRDGMTFDLRFGPNSQRWLSYDDPSVPGAPQVRDITQRLRKDIAGDKNKRRRYDALLGITSYRAQHQAKFRVGFVFRGQVQALVNQTLETLIKQLDVVTARAEQAAFQMAEHALRGTPHYFQRRSIQKILAGHIALLLAGPTQVLFSSPITHVRAMRLIRLGLVRTVDDSIDGEEAQSLRSVLRTRLSQQGEYRSGSWLAFFPENHHDHWHVQFGIDGIRPVAPQAAIERISQLLPLWRFLGIQLEPLMSMLDGLPLNPKSSDAGLAAAGLERELLRKALDGYRPDPVGEERVQRTFAHVFEPDQAQVLDPLAEARNDFGPSHGLALWGLIQEAEALVRRYAPAGVFGRLAPMDDEQLETIPHEELQIDSLDGP